MPKAKCRIDQAPKALPVFKRTNTNSLRSTSRENRKVTFIYCFSYIFIYGLFCWLIIADFFANQESIDYFLEVLTIKREKYASIVPIKEKPLSSNWTEFVLHYWPGMMNCCGHIFTSCKEFQVHFNASHLPPKKIPRPKVVDPSAAFPGPALKPEAVSQSIPSVATSPVSSRSPSQGKQRSREQLAIESAPSRNGMI